MLENGTQQMSSIEEFEHSLCEECKMCSNPKYSPQTNWCLWCGGSGLQRTHLSVKGGVYPSHRKDREPPYLRQLYYEMMAKAAKGKYRE